MKVVACGVGQQFGPKNIRFVLQRRLGRRLASPPFPTAAEMYCQTVSVLDKAIQKGTLHENTASRYKSRLGKRVTAMK